MVVVGCRRSWTRCLSLPEASSAVSSCISPFLLILFSFVSTSFDHFLRPFNLRSVLWFRRTILLYPPSWYVIKLRTLDLTLEVEASHQPAARSHLLSSIPRSINPQIMHINPSPRPQTNKNPSLSASLPQAATHPKPATSQPAKRAPSPPQDPPRAPPQPPVSQTHSATSSRSQQQHTPPRQTPAATFPHRHTRSKPASWRGAPPRTQ